MGEVNCLLPTSTETPDRLEPEGRRCRLPITSPPTNQKKVYGLITPSSLNHCYKAPPSSLQVRTHSLEGRRPLWPPLPGKAIKLFLFSFTQNSVSAFLFGTGAQRPSFSSTPHLSLLRPEAPGQPAFLCTRRGLSPECPEFLAAPVGGGEDERQPGRRAVLMVGTGSSLLQPHGPAQKQERACHKDVPVSAGTPGADPTAVASGPRAGHPVKAGSQVRKDTTWSPLNCNLQGENSTGFDIHHLEARGQAKLR